jgi:hypothetical protein
VHGEPVLITNIAGIVMVSVCCASVSFLVWFLVALSRESRKRSGRRLRVILKATDLEPLDGFEDSVPQYLATTIRMPPRAARSQAANQRAIEIATAGGRVVWERRIP